MRHCACVFKDEELTDHSGPTIQQVQRGHAHRLVPPRGSPDAALGPGHWLPSAWETLGHPPTPILCLCSMCLCRLAWACSNGGRAGLPETLHKNVQSLLEPRQASGTVSVTSATLHWSKEAIVPA